MFKEKYPLDVKSVITTAMVFKESKREDKRIPFPNLKCIRTIAEYAGISYGSVRTTLTRLKNSGEIIAFKDEAGESRYMMGSLLRSLMANATMPERKGFTLAVFSFKKENEQERYRIREILKFYGCKKLAQNVYFNVKVDSKQLMAEVEKWNICENLFLFECENIEDHGMKSRIAALWNIDEYNARLKEFYNDMQEFLKLDGLKDEEAYNRVYYAGAVFYGQIHVEQPPLPAEWMPEDYYMRRILELFGQIDARHGRRIEEFYIELNK